MDAAVVRLRVQFEHHRQILKKSQRSEGLKKSWVLLKPSHRTISDLSDYIFDVYELHHSCPNGILLSMDGFVLPPFELTSILRDKDVIGIKRKEKLLLELTGVDDEQNLLEEGEIVEKQTLVTSTPLLANAEFEQESGGYQSESEEQEDYKEKQYEDDLDEEKSPLKIEVSKKRKASKKLGSWKKKKKKRQASEDDVHIEEIATDGFDPGEGSNKEKKVSELKKKCKRATALVSVESNVDTSQHLPSPKRLSPIQENDTECGASAQAPSGTQKRPSRSARRKKLKRQWLREIVKAEKGLFLLSDHTCSQPGSCDAKLKRTQSSDIDGNKHSVEHQPKNQSCEADKEIAPDSEAVPIVIGPGEIAPDTEAVPIVIRPGHIRFEPLEEDEEALQQRNIPVEITQWNGITNKKKGQKWGREKPTSWRNESQQGSTNEHTKTMEIEEVKPPSDPIDFDNLAPLSRLPREGDLIAYRLVELSSTWTPELTSFRVGKTSWYDSQSNKILLVPLPEYTILIEKQDEEEEDTFAQPPNNSFYKEDDGSLKVDFSSLVDVRMVKESDSDPAKATSDLANGATSSKVILNGNDAHDSTLHSEKQEKAWDEISEALSVKKAELMRENSWMKENSGQGGGSYRAMRGSALGPLMARLRANNEI